MTPSGPKAWLRHIGPAMSYPGTVEALRASFGILLGILALEIFLRPLAGETSNGLFLIAPFGATAVLLFALPNSPLAQPWSAVVGNSVSALVAVLVVYAVKDPVLRVAIATPLAILAMLATRSLHPPGGAVALVTALSPAPALQLGLSYVLSPVALGTLALVIVAIGYGRATGRRYPFRQPAAVTAQGTTDLPAMERLGISRAELAELMTTFRQSSNIGVEDLARLIAAAEALSAQHQTETLTCAEIMSRDLITVTLETPLSTVAEVFRQRGFTSLPVVDSAGLYRGVIFQIHLIRRGQREARRSGGRFLPALARLLGRHAPQPVLAAEIMAKTLPYLPPEASASALLPLLAQGPNDAVPILDGARIVGIVTRTDLIAALAHHRL